ncbi:MAG: hypothetical protein E7645_07985 [Ruminococcaceae bacterium]|nr:hypothetical protein [Oscillospiraceae bacterium]
MKKIIAITTLLLLAFLVSCNTDSSETYTEEPLKNEDITVLATEKDTSDIVRKAEYELKVADLDLEYNTKKNKIISDYSASKAEALAELEYLEELKKEDLSQYRKYSSETQKQIKSTQAAYNTKIQKASSETERVRLRNDCQKKISELNSELSQYKSIHESNQATIEASRIEWQAEYDLCVANEKFDLAELDDWYSKKLSALKTAYGQP